MIKIAAKYMEHQPGVKVEASKRMLSVVGDMLSFSSLEENRTVDAPLLDLTSIAKQVFDELAPLAKQKEVSCLLSGNGKSPIEEKDVYLILKNLVENAILYNVTGGKVTVTLNDCSFSVFDVGIGIPKKTKNGSSSGFIDWINRGAAPTEERV